MTERDDENLNGPKEPESADAPNESGESDGETAAETTESQGEGVSEEGGGDSGRLQQGDELEEDIDDHVLLKRSRRRDTFIAAAALLGTLSVFYFLMTSIPKQWTKDAKEIGTINAKGPIRQRHAGSWQWKDVKPGETTVYLRDVIYVPKESEAVVKLSKKTIELPPDTMIQLDETSLDKFEVTLIDISAPQVMPLPQKTSKLTEYLEDIKGIELRASELKSRTVGKIFSTPDLIRTDKLKKHEFALKNISEFEVHHIAPANERYNLKANRWMQLTWSPVPLKNVSYRLEIAKDSGFHKTLARNTPKTSLMVQFDDEAIYYWRVSAFQGDKSIRTTAGQFSLTLKGGKTPHQETAAGSTEAAIRETATKPSPSPALNPAAPPNEIHLDSKPGEAKKP